MPRRRASRDKKNLRRSSADRRSTSLGLRPLPGGDEWELVHPPCARQRTEDIEEVRQMIDAGELEIAIDELRWLLNGCGDFVEAHRLLGELALAEGDVRLARGHFGYVYQIGLAAIDARKRQVVLPYSRVANRAFLESAKGFAHCLIALKKSSFARDVLERLLLHDPSDTLGAQAMLASLENGETPPDAKPAPK